jgi:hypothetical protein
VSQTDDEDVALRLAAPPNLDDPTSGPSSLEDERRYAAVRGAGPGELLNA